MLSTVFLEFTGSKSHSNKGFHGSRVCKWLEAPTSFWNIALDIFVKHSSHRQMSFVLALIRRLLVAVAHSLVNIARPCAFYRVLWGENKFLPIFSCNVVCFFSIRLSRGGGRGAGRALANQSCGRKYLTMPFFTYWTCQGPGFATQAAWAMGSLPSSCGIAPKLCVPGLVSLQWL